VLEVLAAVLGLGRGSRLHQGLREGLASRDQTSVAMVAEARYEWRRRTMADRADGGRSGADRPGGGGVLCARSSVCGAR
jgi:hypothetical protein